MAAMAAIFDIRMILAVLNLHVAPMPPTNVELKLTYGLAGDVVLKNFKMATMVAILEI